MKKVIVIALCVSVLSSCTKLEDLVKINFVVPYSKTVAVEGLKDNPVIPPVLGLKASIPPIGVATDATENMNNYNTSSDLVKSVVFSYLNIDVNEPSTQTLDMVDSLWLYVSASGLPEVLVSHYYDIPKGLRSLELETSDENMKEYFLRDSMYFRIEGHFYNVPDSGSVFTFSSKMDIVATPLKK